MKFLLHTFLLIIVFALSAQTTFAAVQLSTKEVVQYERKVKVLNRTLNSGRVRARHQDYYRAEMVRLMDMLSDHRKAETEKSLSQGDLNLKRRADLQKKRELQRKQKKIELKKKAADKKFYEQKISRLLKKRGKSVSSASIAKRYEAIVKLQNKKAFEDVGQASYYHQSLHGHITASGIMYDQTKMMAAHRELAFGTQVYVENLDTGKIVKVTITDRGPFYDMDNRIIDLSLAAAEELSEGLLGQGVYRVKIWVD